MKPTYNRRAEELIFVGKGVDESLTAGWVPVPIRKANVVLLGAFPVPAPELQGRCVRVFDAVNGAWCRMRERATVAEAAADLLVWQRDHARILREIRKLTGRSSITPSQRGRVAERRQVSKDRRARGAAAHDAKFAREAEVERASALKQYEADRAFKEKKTGRAAPTTLKWQRGAKAYEARLLSTGVANSTQWVMETWVVDLDGVPEQQCELYYYDGAWHFWSGSVWRDAARSLGAALASERNAEDVLARPAPSPPNRKLPMVTPSQRGRVAARRSAHATRKARAAQHREESAPTQRAPKPPSVRRIANAFGTVVTTPARAAEVAAAGDDAARRASVAHARALEEYAVAEAHAAARRARDEKMMAERETAIIERRAAERRAVVEPPKARMADTLRFFAMKGKELADLAKRGDAGAASEIERRKAKR